MKNLLLTTALFFCFLFVGNSQVSFGIGATYWGDIGAQARADIEMGSFDIIPKASYYFGDATVLTFDVDLAFNVGSIGENPLYIFAGPSIYRASIGGFSTTEIGLNAGLGARFSNIYLEAKYGILLCDGCSGDVGFAAGYMF